MSGTNWLCVILSWKIVFLYQGKWTEAVINFSAETAATENKLQNPIHYINIEKLQYVIFYGIYKENHAFFCDILSLKHSFSSNVIAVSN